MKTLPDPCAKCAPYRGSHQLIEDRGMERCDCARGKLLRRGDDIRRLQRGAEFGEIKVPPPNETAIRAARQAAITLTDIPGCPRDDETITFLADDLLTMVRNSEQLRWLVRRARMLYSHWPGSREIRVLFCQKFMPLDGFEVSGSIVYPDGIPSEHPDTTPFLLPAGRVVSIDTEFDAKLQSLAKTKVMPKIQKRVGARDEYDV